MRCVSIRTIGPQPKAQKRAHSSDPRDAIVNGEPDVAAAGSVDLENVASLLPESTYKKLP